MRNITKGSEPRSLQQHRCNSHADYDNYSDKPDLRTALVLDQKGLCCYCQQRIRADISSMKIEHWKPQTPNPALQLTYSNILGACIGGEGKPTRIQHCDTRKRDTDISFNPANSLHNVENMFSFHGSGRIEAKNHCSALQAELDNILNLNKEILKKNRIGALKSFQATLGKKSLSKQEWHRKLTEWDGSADGELKPFSQVVVYYIRKKLNRL